MVEELEHAVVLTYRQRPLRVTAIRWDPALGAGHGVQARAKKHKANPDEWYVRDRFGKETIIEPGQWVVTYPDGSSAIVPDGTFQDLYEQELGQGAPGGHHEAHASDSDTTGPERVGGGEATPRVDPRGFQGPKPGKRR